MTRSPHALDNPLLQAGVEAVPGFLDGGDNADGGLEDPVARLLEVLEKRPDEARR